MLAMYRQTLFSFGECPHGVMVKAVDCGIEHHSRYYVHFRANTLGKLWVK